jgi:hypothetical protein
MSLCQYHVVFISIIAVKFQVRYCDTSSAILFALNCFDYFRSFVILYEILVLSFLSHEECYWNFYRDCIEHIDCSW